MLASLQTNLVSLVRDLGLLWYRDQVSRLDLVVTLPTGRTLDDWASFLLTIREDPEWPNRGVTSSRKVDPLEDGWESILTASGSQVGVTNVVRFSFTVPANAGINRYTVDMWGIGGAAGNVPLFPATWLSVGGRVR